MTRACIAILFVTVTLFGQTSLGDIISLVNKGKIKEAERKISEFLKAHPGDHRANFIKGLVLLNQEKYQAAVEFVESALSKKPDQPDYLRLAGLLHEKLKEPEKAIIHWKNCLKHAKNDSLRQEAKIHLEILQSD